MKFSDLPTRVQSIRNPRWKDSLYWVRQSDGATADVDHDWRIWVKFDTGKCFVRFKGGSAQQDFGNLALGLAYLDYKEDSSDG